MSYELTKSNGVTLIELNDGLVDDTSASLKFVGRNRVGYGEIQNENFLHLLENFSNTTAPNKPLSGQLWFDSTPAILRLKLYDGTAWNKLPVISQGTQPSNSKQGDLWFDTNTLKLYLNTGTNFYLVGPNTSVESANRLTNSVTINSVEFNGADDITITATTPQSISPGDYLTGDSFDGSAPISWSADVGTVSSPDPFKLVARDNQGNIWFSIGHGEATSTKYADLAEKYICDQEYEVGTVITVGGSKEVTKCDSNCVPIGVVSTKPGLMMNSGLEGGTYIALKGRVPVKILGDVKKGQTLMAGTNGTAVAGNINYFAIALEDSNGKNLIEAVIL